jgi:hypothetical protein
MSRDWAIDPQELADRISDLKVGLDPAVLADWYRVIVNEARRMAPPDLKDSIEAVQDQILPMKFELKASKRVIPHVLAALEKNLPEMAFATRLYFMKLQEIIVEQMDRQSR